MLIGGSERTESEGPRRDGTVDPRLVFFRLPGSTRDQVLGELASRLAAARFVRSAEDLTARLIRRERDGCTAVGRGIAIPHCRMDNLDGEIVAFATTAQPVDFLAADGAPVDLIFLVVSPAQAAAAHLQAVARVSRLLRVPGLSDALRAAGSAEALVSVLAGAESAMSVAR